MTYQTFTVDLTDHIATVRFNRPEKANSLTEIAWEELHQIFDTLDADPDCRVIVLTGTGKHFSAGIDLSLLMDMQKFHQIDCEGRKREALRAFIFKLQRSISAIEACRKPVIAAIHGACLGGGFDIAAACDLRYATTDARFAIKEIDLGFVADIGILQRLPKIIPYAYAAELAYTGREFSGAEAREMHLVNRTYEDIDALQSGVRELATTIAEKSPLSIRGTKENLLYARDHTVAESLNYMTAWNASMLMSNDTVEAFTASMERRAARFAG